MSIQFEREVSESYGAFANSNLPDLMEKYIHLSDMELIEKRNKAIKKQFIKYGPYMILMLALFIIMLILTIVLLNICLGFIAVIFITLFFIFLVQVYSNESDKVLQNRKNPLYHEYVRAKYKYAHVTACPICNKKVEFSEYESLPFQGQCPHGKYIFTVAYRKVKEKYITYGPRGGEHVNRIFYDGIKAIKPITQKIEYYDDSVKIDVRDSILIRSTIIGKKVGVLDSEDKRIIKSKLSNEEALKL